MLCASNLPFCSTGFSDCTMGLVTAVLSGVRVVFKQVQSHTGIVSMHQLMHQPKTAPSSWSIIANFACIVSCIDTTATRAQNMCLCLSRWHMHRRAEHLQH